MTAIEWLRAAAALAQRHDRSTLGTHRALAAARAHQPRLSGKSASRRDESTSRIFNVSRYGRKRW